MAKMTTQERHEKARAKQIEAAKRSQAKARAKVASPEYKAKQLEKARASQQKQREKQQTPEYKAKQQEKAKKVAQRAIEKARTASKAPKKQKEHHRPKAKPPKSKGLLGRTPTAKEKQIMNAIGALPCICCTKHGRHQPIISLHHTDGRVKVNAHAFVLPLCAYHHDTAIDKAYLEKYPDLVPIHAKGTLGGKAQWRKHNGNEMDLLIECFDLIGVDFFTFINS